MHITNRLVDAGNLLDIKILDHIMIGSALKFLNFKIEKLIKPQYLYDIEAFQLKVSIKCWMWPITLINFLFKYKF